MSSVLNDFAALVICKQSIAPDVHSESPGAGTTVDLINADGGGFATLIVGEVDGTSVVINGKLQESVDGTTWTDIAGATFTTVTTSFTTETISFRRTARYVRANITITGTDLGVRHAVVLGQLRKLF